MNAKEFNEFVNNFVADVLVKNVDVPHDFAACFVNEMIDTLGAKEKDYSDADINADRLANFKENGRLCRSHSVQWGFALSVKHLDSIKRHFNGQKCVTEPVRNRLIDYANYQVLLAALIEENCELAIDEKMSTIEQLSSYAKMFIDLATLSVSNTESLLSILIESIYLCIKLAYEESEHGGTRVDSDGGIAKVGENDQSNGARASCG